MRVLHVINSLAAGGAERMLVDLLPRLGLLDVSCSVLVLDGKDDVFSSQLREAGITVEFAREGQNSPYSPRNIAAIVATIGRHEPDIVHAHLGPSMHWCAIASLWARKVVLVTTEHATENRRWSLPLVKQLDAWCYGRYKAIVCVSEDARKAIELRAPRQAKRLAVIPNGIPLGRMSGAKPAPDVVRLLEGRIGIAMTARFVPAKDHPTALRALAILHESHALVMAGDGPELDGARSLAAELGLGPRAIFLGTRNDIPSVLAACRVYLQSSRVEGFGIAALEAMAAGLPVVASDAPGLGALVDGAGLLFPAGDSGKCAECIGALENGQARDMAIATGMRRAAAHRIEGTAEKYEGLYGSLLEGPRPNE
ncbi:MAG TPA: glycosyltransferase [Rectinemataceae bacterium]|nr:glycosyltransferase [Rectinemataceae bacterium]